MDQGQSESRNLIVSDIFFGLAAILLVILALLSANLQSMLESRTASADDTNAAAQQINALGTKIILAEKQGIKAWSSSELKVPLNEVLKSPALSSALQESDLVLVSPDGIEAGFLLSALAARNDIASLNMVWLDGHCRSFEIVSSSALRCLP